MPTITDLHKVYLRQLELVLAESDLLLQKEGGLDGELKTSGSLCEQFLRQTFSKYVVPGQFRVTSGYIATPQLLAEKKNLPQCDLLIADSHIPPLLQLSSSTIEVLPIEATIGLIEAKRTLTKKTLADALDHLAKVIDSTGRASMLKTDRELNRYNKYVGFDNSSSDKPLIGVVGLNSSFSNFGREVSELIVEKQSLVDFVWTLDGFALVPSFQTSADTLLHYTHTARPDTKTWTHLRTLFTNRFWLCRSDARTKTAPALGSWARPAGTARGELPGFAGALRSLQTHLPHTSHQLVPRHPQV